MKAVLKFIKIFVLTFVGIIAALLIIAFLLPSNDKKSEKTPTPEMLIQAQATTEPTVTEENIPDYCKDLQLPLTMTADKLEAEGFSNLERWIPEDGNCYYSLRDTKSFLNTDTLGYISFIFTEAGEKQLALLAVKYKENDRIQEIYNDWGAAIISNMTGVDVITAKELFVSAANVPMDIYDHYLLLSELDREHMEYRFSISDLNLTEQEK